MLANISKRTGKSVSGPMLDNVDTDDAEIDVD